MYSWKSFCGEIKKTKISGKKMQWVHSICSQLRAWRVDDKIKTKYIKKIESCRDSPAGKMEKRCMSGINKDKTINAVH